MSRLKDKIKYNIKNHTLIIDQCPNNILSFNNSRLIFHEKKIKKVIIKEGVEVIDAWAFEGCIPLESVSLPNSLKVIKSQAFSRCKNLKKINIPDNVEIIDYGAFEECESLKKIRLPKKIDKIDVNAFRDCANLEKVIMGDGLKEIGEMAFYNCVRLKNIKIPSTVNNIGRKAFYNCSNLRKISIPEGVETLDGCFGSCKNLSNVILPESLKTIGIRSFEECFKLYSIKLPERLEQIGDYSFVSSGLYNIEIPNNIVKIGHDAFASCQNLTTVKLNVGLKELGVRAFSNCRSLCELDLPNTIEVIRRDAFYSCENLSYVKLPDNLKNLSSDVFERCYRLKQVVIPEGVTSIDLSSFYMCDNLEHITFPKSLEYFFLNYHRKPKFKKISLITNDGILDIDMKNKSLLVNDHNKLFLFDKEKNMYSFYHDGKYVEFEAFFYKNHPRLDEMSKEYAFSFTSVNYINLYLWSQKKIIPSLAVIETMSIKYIDNFFINKNCNEWAKLIKEIKITDSQDVSSFFKLCFVLGVFSESTSDRDKAVDFIRENIIGKMTDNEIHAKFDGFDLNQGFKKEYAEFFMKYYDGKNFMIIEDDDDDKIDLTCASYNSYENVKKIYPNKTIHTNRNADLLLPEHVINAVSSIEYDDINEGNEQFAVLLGRYGYSQESFDKLQQWYDDAKKIKEEDMKLFIKEDEEISGITYKLLKKDDPISAVLGDITNCCQIVNGAGEDCVKYGMRECNSGFITFNYKDKVIGQAWVWYDENSKTVCLDNIEVPHKYLDKINSNREIQNSFISCLLRVEENFKKEMNLKGFQVDKVTIGKGYNDLLNVLKKSFVTMDKSSKLKGYSGYSDATYQYVITNQKNR